MAKERWKTLKTLFDLDRYHELDVLNNKAISGAGAQHMLNMLEQKELTMAKDALKWAARTYVVAALGALASLLYWAIQILGSRD